MLNRNFPYIAALLILIAALLFVPTGFESLQPKYAEQVKVTVLDVDNRLIHSHGIIKAGAQLLKVRIEGGQFAKREVRAENRMIGKLELDKMFVKGDRAFATLKHHNGEVLSAVLHDHYRLDIQLILFVVFLVFIVLTAGVTGLRAGLTFVFTALFLWKILFPAFLRGWDPVWAAVASMLVLSFVIIYTVAGFSKKGTVAFLGAVSGIAVTCLLSLIFGHFFKLHGAVRPFSETLLHTGYSGLNISKLFLSGIFIASSGAVMDVGMDISASMNELMEKKVALSMKERFKSGMEVGKAVIGTMTTTLLLAYTGGYTAMFMVFIAQGATVSRILNMQYVSAELLHTLVGSFGLVTVAPLTAFFGALIFKPHTDKPDAMGR
jgi:uncharacterized membrane protein